MASSYIIIPVQLFRRKKWNAVICSHSFQLFCILWFISLCSFLYLLFNIVCFFKWFEKTYSPLLFGVFPNIMSCLVWSVWTTQTPHLNWSSEPFKWWPGMPALLLHVTPHGRNLCPILKPPSTLTLNMTPSILSHNLVLLNRHSLI